MAQDTTSDGTDQDAYNETEVSGRHLTDGLPARDDDQTDVQKELERLEDVANMTGPLAVNAEGNITKVAHRVTVAIHLDEHPPQLVSRVSRQNSEDGVQADTGSPSQLRKGPPSGEGTEDIGCDQVEDGAPSRSPGCARSVEPLRVADLPAFPARAPVTVHGGFLVEGFLLSGHSCLGDGKTRLSRMPGNRTSQDLALDEGSDGPAGLFKVATLAVEASLFLTRNLRIVQVLFERDLGIVDGGELPIGIVDRAACCEGHR